MTIGKRLYAGFGIILGVLALLLIVNLITAGRQSSASQESGLAVESFRTIEDVRNKFMLNRLNLNNFLLSGDPRDEDKVNKGMTDLSDLLKRSQAQTSNDSLRMALIQVETNESSWADNFSKPLLAKRHQVDSGDATVSDLQIFYLQRDPASWLTKSSTILDQSRDEINKSLDVTKKSADGTRLASIIVTTAGTFLAILAGILIAFKTSKSISEPLTHLITVAREIGDSGSPSIEISLPFLW